MRYDTIVGYAYEAAIHCVACTQRRSFRRSSTGLYKDGVDEHGIAYTAVDRDGNPVHPVFAGECSRDEYCDDCGGPVFETCRP